MTRLVERLVQHWLKIPPPPTPPWGDPSSVRVYRPGPGAVRYEMARWLIKESWAIVLAVVTVFFPEALPDFRFLRWLSADWMQTIELLFLFALPLVLPVTFFWALVTVRARRYLLTDRSLRLREGLWSVREMTISLANVQNVTLKQGPIQRLFGLADVEVRTAGGGEGSEEDGATHRGLLRGLADAETVRDRIVAATRVAQESPAAVAGEPVSDAIDVREALREAAQALAEEAKALGAHVLSVSRGYGSDGDARAAGIADRR